MAATTGLISTATTPNLAQTAAIPDTSVTTPAAVTPVATSTDTPANVASVAAPAASTPRSITDPETVSGQLNTLLAADSPYIQSARNAGMATANSRGLINSSLAAGTAERSAIDSAEPIAAADAATNAAAGLSAQNSNQDMSLSGYNSMLASAQNKENFGYTTAENQQNIDANTDLQNTRLQSAADLQTQQINATQAAATQQQAATSTLQTNLKNMDINLSLDQLDQTSKSAFTTAVSPIMQQTQASIQAIQTTPDSQMSADAKALAISQLTASMQANVSTMSSLYNYPLTWGAPAGPTPNTPGQAIPNNPYAPVGSIPVVTPDLVSNGGDGKDSIW